MSTTSTSFFSSSSFSTIIDPRIIIIIISLLVMMMTTNNNFVWFFSSVAQYYPSPSLLPFSASSSSSSPTPPLASLSSSLFFVEAAASNGPWSPNPESGFLSYVGSNSGSPYTDQTMAFCTEDAAAAFYYCGTDDASSATDYRITKYTISPWTYNSASAQSNKDHDGCVLTEDLNLFWCHNGDSTRVRAYSMSTLALIHDRSMSKDPRVNLIRLNDFLYFASEVSNRVIIFRIKDISSTPVADTSFHSLNGRNPFSMCLTGVAGSNNHRMIVGSTGSGGFGFIEMNVSGGSTPVLDELSFTPVDGNGGAYSALVCTETRMYHASGSSSVTRWATSPVFQRIDDPINFFKNSGFFYDTRIQALRILADGDFLLASVTLGIWALHLIDLRTWHVIDSLPTGLTGTNGPLVNLHSRVAHDIPSGTDPYSLSSINLFSGGRELSFGTYSRTGIHYNMRLNNLDQVTMGPSSTVVRPPRLILNSTVDLGQSSKRFSACAADTAEEFIYCLATPSFSGTSYPIRLSLSPLTVAASGATTTASTSTDCALAEAFGMYACRIDTDLLVLYGIPSLSTLSSRSLATGSNHRGLSFVQVGSAGYFFVLYSDKVIRCEISGSDCVGEVEGVLDAGATLAGLRHCGPSDEKKIYSITDQTTGKLYRLNGTSDNFATNAGYEAELLTTLRDGNAEGFDCTADSLFVSNALTSGFADPLKLIKISIASFSIVTTFNVNDYDSSNTKASSVAISHDNQYVIVNCEDAHQVLIFSVATMAYLSASPVLGTLPWKRCVSLSKNNKLYCPSSNRVMYELDLIPYDFTTLTNTKTLISPTKTVTSTVTGTLQSVTVTKSVSSSATLFSRSASLTLFSRSKSHTFQTLTQSITATITKSLQSLTLSKTETVSRTRSISQSLQSLTPSISVSSTGTRTKTFSLQSLTHTRTLSSSPTVQSLTETRTVSATSSVSFSASLQSLTQTKTVSVTITPQSLTATQSISASVSLQSLTRTSSLSKTGSLQSLTASRSSSKSLSLQSLTRTQTVSASSTLQSQTSTQSKSGSASLQSLTRTFSTSKSASLQSLTSTRSLTTSASLQSLTGTRTASTTKSSSTSGTLVSLTLTKSSSKSVSLQSLTKTKTRSVSSSLQSITRTVSSSKSATLQSLTNTRTTTASNTLRSLTATRSISSTASLQSLTVSRSPSKSFSLQSRTVTSTHSSSASLQSISTSISISKTGTLQSLTSTRTTSPSHTLRSLSATHTVSSTKTTSASPSLQSLTVSRSSTGSASLKSATVSKTISPSPSLQSLTRTASVSRSASLQSLTNTKTASGTKTLQSLTTTRSISSTVSLQSLTTTKSESRSSSVQSLTKTSTRTVSPQSLTRTTTLSLVPSLLFFTPTQTKSASASLQSHTITSSSSKTISLLRSVTQTETASVSRTLQSRTSTQSRSTSVSLQSLTRTSTISKTASLQSLTATQSLSTSSSLQSPTTTQTRTTTASLQSLTSTTSSSKSSSLQSLSKTSTRTASPSLQSLTATHTISDSATLQSLTASRTRSSSVTPLSLTRTATISRLPSVQFFTPTKTKSISSTVKSITTTLSISKTVSLQSLTSTRSLTTSASLQSLTETRTVSTTKSSSTSGTLVSLTLTESSSKSVSLQSLTKTKTLSATPSLQSITWTVSSSKSATLQSLTNTRTTTASNTLRSLTATRSISSTASLQSLTLTLSSSKSATPFSLTKTATKSVSATPFSLSKSLTPVSVTKSVSASLTKSSTITSSRSSTASASIQSLTVTLTPFSRSSTLSSSKTTSKTSTFTLPPTPSRTRSLTATKTRSASLQSLTKTKSLSKSLQSLTKTKTKTSLATPPPATTTTSTTSAAAGGDNAINNLPPSSNILNALVVSVPSCPSSLTSKCQVRHPQSNECRCPQNTYEQNITLLPSFAFLPSTSPTSQLIDRVGNPCVRNEFTLGICTASTSERYISSYTRSGGTASENGICEQANPFTNDCSCRVPSTKAAFAIATGSSSSFIKKFVTFCLPSNGDLSVFWTIHPDVATTSSASSNRAETSCVSPNGNVTCECTAGASKTTFGVSIFPPDSASTDPVPGDLTFCKAKPAEPEEEVNLPVTTTGTVVGIVGGFVEGGGANAVVGIQVAALLMTLCDNNPNVSTSGAKSVVVFFEYPGLDPSLGGLAFMLTLTLGVFTLHALLCLLLGFKRFATTEPIEFDPDRIDFFEDEIESPSFLEQIRFASLQLRFPHWSFFVMNIGFSGVVVESTILLQDTESDVNVLIGAIGLVLAIIYIALTLYYSYWGLRSVAPQKLFDIVESDQLQKIKKERKKLRKEKKKLKEALKGVTVVDDDETSDDEDIVDDNNAELSSSPRHRLSRHQRNRSRQRSQSSPGRRNVVQTPRNNYSSSWSSRAQSSSRNKKKNSRNRNVAVSPRSVKGGFSSSDASSDDRIYSSSSSSSDAEEEDGHKWFSRRKSIHSPSAASSKRRQSASPSLSSRSSLMSPPVRKSSSRSSIAKRKKPRVATTSQTDTKEKSPTDDRASSVVQINADEDDCKKHSVIIEDAKENGEFSKDESGLKQPEELLENTNNAAKFQTVIQKKINKTRKGPQSLKKRNPLRAPPRRTLVEDDTSSAEDLDLDDEQHNVEGEEEEEEEPFDGSFPKDTATEEEELTEDDKPPHYVKYGKAIQMFAKYCGAGKYLLPDGWWIKFRLYNCRYASMYNSFQPRPTAWAPTIVRVFMFSVSIASSLGGCVIPLTYVGTVALLIAIFFLGSRPCRRPFDNFLLALQLILAATLAFSRSSDPELSVNLFYGVVAVTFVYVLHICLMEALESFSMSALELDARDNK